MYLHISYFVSPFCRYFTNVFLILDQCVRALQSSEWTTRQTLRCFAQLVLTKQAIFVGHPLCLSFASHNYFKGCGVICFSYVYVWMNFRKMKTLDGTLITQTVSWSTLVRAVWYLWKKLIGNYHLNMIVSVSDFYFLKSQFSYCYMYLTLFVYLQSQSSQSIKN